MNFNGTNKSYQACSIILLKIDFEGIINLGGENTHLNSMLRTRSAAISACCGGRRNVADRRIPPSAIARSGTAPFLSFDRTLSLSLLLRVLPARVPAVAWPHLGVGVAVAVAGWLVIALPSFALLSCLSLSVPPSLSAVVSQGGRPSGPHRARRWPTASRRRSDPPLFLSLSPLLAFVLESPGWGVETHPFSGLPFAARQRNGASAPFDDFPLFVCVCVCVCGWTWFNISFN